MTVIELSFEQAMLVLDKALQKKHLSNIQEMVLRLCWSGYTYAEIAESSGYDDDYIRDVGFRLWQMLSKALGENIAKSNVKTVLRRHYSSLKQLESQVSTIAAFPTPKIQQQQDWGEAIDVSVFYGRQKEQELLQRWIIDEKCRLLMLLGMGGIGKTALSVKVAEKLQSKFDFVFWRSLRNSPAISDLMRELISFVSQQSAASLPENLDVQISYLMKYLRSRRCLILLDNIESLLQSGETSGHYCAGYEGYGQLLRRIGDEVHQSCLVFTTRETPSGFTAREGDALPVRSLQLTGLSAVESQQILATKGLVDSTDECQQLIQRYAGNPLALKIVATTIQHLFDGNICQFLQQGSVIFGDIWEILEQQFNRLSANEKQVMYSLAVKQDWVSLQQLQQYVIPQISERELLEALFSLQRRSLIEQRSANYTQPTVVMEYVSENLIGKVCCEIPTAENYSLA
ncbi:NACHT domain-containing protein [Calothrix sp. FACHB-1219]|uniref:NB-ARC domain-containing protein n=1 Tax=unclassified Calothrix TaxID=2619626 RepID=UPI0016872E6A|nr:NB-ARC domain-containing protein [Calothrix sp. FACHB-168]MBD2202986.1 NACHT domain-containing protein [Calothrix sp. FACHB-168]MBD2216114.1 NACHT domain-containing protein [Calothrix sp. FACHB-1219]